MEQLTPSEMLTYSTVRIECKLASGGGSTGTGFFFRFLNRETTHVPAIVTNKHVVEGAAEGSFKMHEAGTDGSPHPKNNLDVRLDRFATRWIPHPDPNVDLCVLPAAPIFRAAEGQGKRVFVIPLDPSLIPSRQQLDALTAVEDILMIGYPNGIWDSANNMPIVRKGITATPPAKNYDGQSEFMIDAACSQAQAVRQFCSSTRAAIPHAAETSLWERASTSSGFSMPALNTQRRATSR